MAVKIITDSLGDIPPKVAEKLGISVVPIHILFGKKVYRDGIDMTPEQFYGKLQGSRTLPTTLVPPLEVFVEKYDKLDKGADGILVLTSSHKLSASYRAALQAKEMRKGHCPLEVLDSTWIVTGHGLIVIAAAKAAKSGAGLEKLMDLTRKNISRVDTRMIFDTLEYLRKGGRIGKAKAFLGSMIKVNHILGIKDGEVVPFARERSRAKVMDYLYDFVTSFSRIEEMAIEDATTPDEAEILAEKINDKFPKERIYRAKIGPAVGTHVGPRALGVAVLGDRE